jgi:hypothetical protein
MNIIKGLPALVIEEQEIRRFAAALEDVVATAEHTTSAMVGLGWRMARHHSRERWSRRSPSPGVLSGRSHA